MNGEDRYSKVLELLTKNKGQILLNGGLYNIRYWVGDKVYLEGVSIYAIKKLFMNENIELAPLVTNGWGAPWQPNWYVLKKHSFINVKTLCERRRELARTQSFSLPFSIGSYCVNTELHLVWRPQTQTIEHYLYHNAILQSCLMIDELIKNLAAYKHLSSQIETFMKDFDGYAQKLGCTTEDLWERIQ